MNQSNVFRAAPLDHDSSRLTSFYWNAQRTEFIQALVQTHGIVERAEPVSAVCRSYVNRVICDLNQCLTWSRTSAGPRCRSLRVCSDIQTLACSHVVVKLPWQQIEPSASYRRSEHSSFLGQILELNANVCPVYKVTVELLHYKY